MTPVFYETANILSTGNYKFEHVENISTHLQCRQGPAVTFLKSHADLKEKTFFMEAANQLWPPAVRDTLTEDSLAFVLPAFTVSELREAFEIGFLLYLPFIVIDLIVSNILLAMGMMMVSPLTISLPFKLFLFVMVDGWSRLILGLVTSYQTTP